MRRRLIDPGELEQLSLRLSYPASGRDAARQAQVSGADWAVVDFLESIPGQLQDETELLALAENQPIVFDNEVASQPLPFPES